MKKIKFNKKYIRIVALSLVITSLYVFFFSELRPVRFVRLKLTDFFYTVKYHVTPLPKETADITVLAIEDESFGKLEARWPWPRTLIAEVVEKASRYGPRLVCVDLDLSDESADSSEDRSLAAALKAAGNVILASHFTQDGKYVPPAGPLKKAALSSGFVHKLLDIDSVTRDVLPIAVSPDGEKTYYSLALEAASRSRGIPLENTGYKPGGILRVNFTAKAEDFRVIPVWKVIQGEARPEDLAGKIVLLGITPEAFHDICYTPFKIFPGVLMEAEETLMYLSRDFIKDSSPLSQYNVIFALVLITLLSVYQLDIMRAGMILALEITTFLFLSFYLFTKGVILDFFGGVAVTSVTFIGYYVYKNISLLLQNARLRNEALTDGLTKFYVFRYFDLKLKSDFAKALKENKNLAVFIADVDDFKKINDTYGHEQGNVVLTRVAEIMRRRSRRLDIIARFTGTSFCVYMADTGFHGALRYAENLRKEVEALQFIATKGRILKITISCGIATLRSFSPKSHAELIKAADAALFRAKNTGKNKVCLYDKNLDIITS